MASPGGPFSLLIHLTLLIAKVYSPYILLSHGCIWLQRERSFKGKMLCDAPETMLRSLPLHCHPQQLFFIIIHNFHLRKMFWFLYSYLHHTENSLNCFFPPWLREKYSLSFRILGQILVLSIIVFSCIFSCYYSLFFLF